MLEFCSKVLANVNKISLNKIWKKNIRDKMCKVQFDCTTTITAVMAALTLKC